MDSLLKEDKLDLCLTPYAVLATSCSEGFVQFIRGATPLADIKSIQDTLRTFRPSSSAPYGWLRILNFIIRIVGIEADVLNNYIKSCAGYSIICYILGVGDRHLHNLLLCENGLFGVLKIYFYRIQVKCFTSISGSSLVVIRSQCLHQWN